MKHKKTALILASVSALGSFSAATQILAKKLAYHSLLGDPLFYFQQTPIYAPYKYLTWSNELQEVVPIPIAETLPFLLVPLIGGALAATALVSEPKEQTSHGTAKWGEFPEDYYKAEVLKKPNIFQSILNKRPAPKGIFLGQTENEKGRFYLTDSSNRHAVLTAPTRSGKGTGHVVPTALTWEESIIINDLKGEIWRKTAWTRKKMGQIVIKFDPVCSDGSATPKNPLDEIRIRTFDEKRDAGNIAAIITDPNGDKKKADFWDSTAKEFIIAVILHLKYTMPSPSLTDVSIFMRDTSAPLEERLIKLLEYPHDPSGKIIKEIYGENSVTHPEIARGFRSFLNCPDETRGGILKSAETFLDLFSDPLVKKNTETSGFMIDDLVFHDKPVSLYIKFMPDDLIRLKPLLRLMIVQILGRLTNEDKLDDEDLITENAKYKHKLLLLMDEFANLGKLDVMEGALTYMAGYGIKALLVIQDLEQLNNVYGQHNQIISGCHTRIFHAPNEITTGKYISDLLGPRTITTQSIQYSGPIKWLSKRTITEQNTGRPLLFTNETSEMDKNKEIVFVTGNHPLLVNKSCYYLDATFLNRMGTREQRMSVKSDYIHHDKDVSDT